MPLKEKKKKQVPKKKAKKSKRLTMKQVLKAVVAKLNEGSDESKNLWKVLSALRGPDDEYSSKKVATTAVIRWKIGLAQGVVPADVEKDNRHSSELRKEVSLYNHFERHAHDAFLALGMKWDAVNK